jgi:PAS domain S-box-containing protein
MVVASAVAVRSVVVPLLVASYDARLVVASVVVATLAGYTALTLTARVSAATRWRRGVWLAAGALAMGIGIWGMHFVGMLALELPVPVTYDAIDVGASVAVAFIASALALAVASRARLEPRQLLVAGVALGAGIVAMHYIGMAAMRLPGTVSYAPWRVAASILVAIVVAIAALRLAVLFRDDVANNERTVAPLRKWGAAALIGTAVAGMHYTAMWAAHFHGAAQGGLIGGSAGVGLVHAQMAVLVGVATVLILAAASAAALVDRGWRSLEAAVAQRTAHLAAALEEVRAGETRFRQLLDASTEGIAVIREGVVLETNGAWKEIFGYDADEVRGVAITDLVAPEEEAGARGWLATEATGDFELMCRRRNWTAFQAAVSMKPCIWNGGPARVIVLRDISSAQRVERLKNELVSTVSHELRTPLTSIRGALGLLESGMGGALSPASLHLIQIGRSNCDRLIRLINDLLDLDKINAGRLELRPEPLAIADLVGATLESLRPMADEYGARLVNEAATEAIPWVSADRDRLTQVLTNLMANAIKYSPPASTIVVRTAAIPWLAIGEWGTAGRPLPTSVASGLDRPASRGVRVSIENPGPGIAAEDIPRLFQRFQQLDGSDTRSRGGTGLGLAIAKAIVERHHGSIGVESEPNVRTTFWVELPGIASDAAPMPDTVLGPVLDAAPDAVLGAVPAPESDAVPVLLAR